MPHVNPVEHNNVLAFNLLPCKSKLLTNKPFTNSWPPLSLKVRVNCLAHFIC